MIRDENGKWLNSSIFREEALKYVKRSDFKKLSPGAYEKSKLLNIFEDVCKHMPVPFKQTIDLLKKEALKYNTLTEFTKNSLIAYNRAKKINILDLKKKFRRDNIIFKANHIEIGFIIIKVDNIKYFSHKKFLML